MLARFSSSKILLGLAAAALILAAWTYSRHAPAPIETSHPQSSPKCETCHAEIAATFRKTGMGRSFSRIRPDNKPAPTTYYHKSSDTHYAMLERNGETFQRRWQIGFDGHETNIEEKRVDYVMGSGNHSRTFLHLTARNTLQQLPLHWYAEKGGAWAMSPGFDRPDYPSSQRLAGYNCMFCHNAYPQIPAGYDEYGAEARFLAPLPEGINCQRCHGPGERHIALATKPGATSEDITAAIVNPRRLPREREMEVCMQCHLSTTGEKLPAAIVRPERGPFSYTPGEPLADFRLSFDRAADKNNAFENLGSAYRLRQSRCFLESEKLQCTTCHNPHDIPRGEAATAYYNGKCRDCHASVPGPEHRANADCVSCHMPKRRTDDEVHVVMTDHYIQRRKPSGNLLAEKAETHETPATQYRGEVVLYYPPKLPDTPENALALAIAQIRDGSNLRAGVPTLAALLEKHRPTNARYYADLAEAYLASGNPAQAIHYFEEAVNRSKTHAFLLPRLGSALLESGQWTKAEQVLRRAITLAPDDAIAWGMLGWSLFQQRDTAGAKAALEKAVALDAESPEAHSNLASFLGNTGDMPNAEKELRAAIKILPSIPQWHSTLGGLLADQNKLTEAAYHFAQTLRLSPQDREARQEYAKLLAAIKSKH